jgi:hypothetical protein
MRSLSIIIRVESEFIDLLPFFKAADDQVCGSDFEFVIISDSSYKGSLKLGKGRKCRRLFVENPRIQDPAVLNEAAALAQGDVLLYTVSDAWPLTKHWLQAAVDDCGQRLTAGVCAPILSASEAGLTEQVYTYMVYADAKLRGKRRFDQVVPEFCPLNMALPRGVWRHEPFPQNISLQGSVDEWARGLLRKGYELVYDPQFAVRHTRDLDWPGIMQDMRQRSSGQMSCVSGFQPRR